MRSPQKSVWLPHGSIRLGEHRDVLKVNPLLLNFCAL